MRRSMLRAALRRLGLKRFSMRLVREPKNRKALATALAPWLRGLVA